MDKLSCIYPTEYLLNTAHKVITWQNNPLHAHVLAFCKQWLTGQATFALQTSGSTGKPKTILLTRQQMQASAALTKQALRLKPGMTCLVCLNTQYIAGLMMLVRALEIGMDMYVVPPSANPLAVLSQAQIPPPDFAAFVPLQLQTPLQHAEQQPHYLTMLNAMKVILVGGAAVSHTLAQQIETLKVPVYQSYAMTETASHVALQLLNTPNKQAHFHVLPTIHIAQDQRHCLIVQGAVTNHQPIVTNDIVQLIAKDQFRWIGRADNTLNSGGVKIQVEDVEQAVQRLWQELGYTNRFFVHALPDQRLGQRIVLIVEALPHSIEPQRVETLYPTYFPNKYAIPKQIIQVERFVETPTQKIDKLQTLSLISHLPQG